MGEDEFYDAVENALDKLEEEQEYRDKLKLMSNAMSHQPETISEATQHQLWSTINTVRSRLGFTPLYCFVFQPAFGCNILCGF